MTVRRFTTRSRLSNQWLKRLPHRLQLQGLEDRTVPNSYVVTLASDTGAADAMFPASKGDLRYVLGLANANGVADDITFDSSVTSISLSSVTGQLLITESSKGLLIDGGGKVTIKNTAAPGIASRIFNVTATGKPAIELRGLTLTGGNLGSGANGAAVLFTDQALTLNNCVVTGNKTTSAGGGIVSDYPSANLTVTNCTFSNNSAGTTGGAIQVSGSGSTVTINGSTFTNNTATTTGGAVNIGVDKVAASLTVIVNGPTLFKYNTAGSHGGAINGATSLTLNMSINSGSFFSNTAGGNGGAIASSSTISSPYSQSTISLTNCTLANNIANTISSNGGAFSSAGAITFNAADSTFRDNTSINNGGGLRIGHATSTVTLTRCSVTGNTAAIGGGISLDSPSSGAQLNVFESTLAANQALGASKGGGAIFTSVASISIRNSTISGNAAYGSQGGGAIGIYSAGFKGTLNVESSTVTNNKAPNGKGGGLVTRLTNTVAATLNLHNSIWAGNSALAGPEFYNIDPNNLNTNAPISADYCLIGSNENNLVMLTSTVGTTVGASDTMPLNPMLAPLSTNGGLGMTHLPLNGSPANNAGSATATSDQLGQTRSVMTDIGAVEWHIKPPTAKATLPNVTTAGSIYTATVVFSDNTAVNSATIDTMSVLLSGPGYAVPISPSSLIKIGTGTVTATYTFAAPGGAWTKSANGEYTLTLLGGKVFDDAMPANAAIGAVLGTFQVALGDNFVVTVNSDEDDGNTAANDLSLREAIALANADPATPDTITFDSIAFGSTISMGIGTLGQINISGPVTITGPSKSLTLDAGQLSRHFRIDGPGQFGVTMEGFSLINGKGTDTTTAGRGGSILMQDESLMLSKMTLMANESATAGGAVAISGPGNLTILDSKLTGNAAKGTGGLGGAVSMHGSYATSFTMTRSTISGNTSDRTGGGLYIRGTVSIQDSTIDTNTATFATTALIHGGGIFLGGNPAGAGWRIRNSTISGNVAKDSGGGIGFTSNSASLTIQNSTITNNTANSTATTTGTGGGGVALITGTAGLSTITLDSTIVAGNSSGNLFKDLTTASNLFSNYSAIGVSNLGGIGSGSSTVTYVGGVNNVAPLLAPLDDYGGPTRTHALQNGSPMLNAGKNVAPMLTYDQRGVGHPRLVGTETDIGAFEGITPVPQAAGTLYDITEPGMTPNTITITYSDDNAIDPMSIDVNDITITTPTGGKLTITDAMPSGGGNIVSVVYSYQIPGGDWNPIDNGIYTVTVNKNQVSDLDMPVRTVPVTAIGTFKVGVYGNLKVDTNIDESDNNYSANDLSLREAIELANLATTGACSISFDTTVFANDKTIDFNSSGKGEIKISAPMEITGPTASKLTITGSNAIRVFNINPVGSSKAVFLSNLTITGGKTTGSNNGAGILLADDDLTLTNVKMTGNASNQNGGAIAVSGGFGTHLTVKSSVISNNTANATTSTSGGAIFAALSSLIDIQDSTVSDNIAGNGGAIRFDSGAELQAVNSTFSGNIAINADPVGNRGGGMMFLLTGSATFTNCTISGNKATVRSGGAILLSSQPASLILYNTTVAYNEAVDLGGGIRVSDPGQLFNMYSSIVAKNSKSGVTPDDISAPNIFGINGTNNLVGVGDGITFDAVNIVGTSFVPIDPMLGALANNGGPTMTHALMKGSPAIDNGVNILTNSVVPNDQRGLMRTFDYVSVPSSLMGADGTDMGSYELQSPPTAKVLINGIAAAQRSLVTSIKVTFSEAVSFPMGVANAFALERYAKGPTTGSVGFNVSPSSGPATDVTITFTNSGAVGLDPGNSLQDGQYKLTIFASKVVGEAGTLDGDGDMVQEGSPIDDKVTTFHRLFGDSDGNGAVNSDDFAAFRGVFGLPGASIFDFNNDGITNSDDFAAFRARFGLNGYLPVP